MSTLRGTVVDSETEKPIPGARVSEHGGKASGTSSVTDSKGRFKLVGQFLAGPRVHVQKDGFRPVIMVATEHSLLTDRETSFHVQLESLETHAQLVSSGQASAAVPGKASVLLFFADDAHGVPIYLPDVRPKPVILTTDDALYRSAEKAMNKRVEQIVYEGLEPGTLNPGGREKLVDRPKGAPAAGRHNYPSRLLFRDARRGNANQFGGRN
jgi:hypothetical protein